MKVGTEYPKSPCKQADLIAQDSVVAIEISGSDYAAAEWVVSTAGSGGITAEYTTDKQGINAVNWLTPPYSKRTDAASANPSITPWANNGPVAGTFETPLPGNCTAFRIRYQTAGTATTITLSGGLPYVPGVPVVATLYDVTEGVIGAGINIIQAPFDVSGWTEIDLKGTSPTTKLVSIGALDDTGALVAGATWNVPAAAFAFFVVSRNPTVAGVGTVGANSTTGIPLSRSMTWFLPSGGTISTGRIRVEASR